MKTFLTLKDAQIIQRVLNLTRHPLCTWPDRDELPAWYEAVHDLRKLVQTVEIEGVASTQHGPGFFEEV